MVDIRIVEPDRTYQPLYVRGKGVTKRFRFQRECESRYPVIQDLASRFDRAFSVLDIGGNYGYFDFRLTEEFDCSCVVVDNKPLAPVIEANEAIGRVSWICSRPKAGVYRAWSNSDHFDVVLALSVLHHMDDPQAAFRAFCRLGRHVLFEIPGEDDATAANPEKHAEIRSLFEGYEPIGISESHLGSERPLYLLENDPVLIEQTIDAPDRDAPQYGTYTITDDFSQSWISIDRGGVVERRPFISGMNLYNFIRLGGRTPNRKWIEAELSKHADHPDFHPWNFILGNGIHPIDEF